MPTLFAARVGPSEIGVRTSAVSGVLDEDLGPGWHWRVPGVHKLIRLPSTYFMLDYTDDDKGLQKPLVIRTKDNNTVELDVSVPIRIKPGSAHEVVAVGNHATDSDGRYRYQRLAEETATSVLREQMANLDSVGFYKTDRRLAASDKALATLNKQLASMHLEAEAVLVRQVVFRAEYEKQLQQIQLNEQNKLLDAASQKLAGVQQSLDNYVQGTSAQVVGAHAGLDQAKGRARARLPGRAARRVRRRHRWCARQARHPDTAGDRGEEGRGGDESSGWTPRRSRTPI